MVSVCGSMFLHFVFSHLHRGACGEVRLAFQRTPDRKFAVKIIPKKSFSLGVCNMLFSCFESELCCRHLSNLSVLSFSKFKETALLHF